MATRVNTKFVLILSIVVMGGAIIVGGLFFLRQRGDTLRMKNAGDSLVAEGNLRKAIEKYGRAVRKKPGNREYIGLYQNTLLQIRPKTLEEANTLYYKYLGSMRQVARYFSREPEGHLRLIEEYERTAHWFGNSDPRLWETLENAADDMWQKVSPEEPRRNMALAYQGLARLKQNISPVDNDEGIRDIKLALEKNPDNDTAWTALIRHKIQEADELRHDGRERRAGEAYDEADAFLRDALDQVSAGPQIMKIHASRLAMRLREGDSTITDERLRSVAESLVQLARNSDKDWLIFETANTLLLFSRINGAEYATRMLRDYIDDHPEEVILRLELAKILYQTRAYEEAARAADTVLNAETMSVDLMTSRQWILRRGAGALLVDIAFAGWQTAAPEKREAAIEQIKRNYQKLSELIGEEESNFALVKGAAKLAFARGKWMEAANHFEKLIDMVDLDVILEPEIYVLFSRCLERLGETGGALSHLEKALLSRPRNVLLLQDQARLLSVLKRYQRAETIIRQALRIEPDNDRSQQIATVIANSMAIAQGGQVEDPVLQALVFANTKFREKDFDGARVILLEAQRGYEQNFKLLKALTLLEWASGNTDEVEGYLDQALAVNPQDAQLRGIRISLNAGDPVEALVSMVNASTEDEGERAIMLLTRASVATREYEALVEQFTEQDQIEQVEKYRGYARQARALEDKAFADLMRLNPDLSVLIEYQFSKALRAENWSQANEMVVRAGELNSDMADGLMFEGRYALARKDYARAVTSLEAAVKIRGYSAIAWRGLGMAYRHVGRIKDCLGAFERAYRSNPNNPESLGEYVEVMIQLGQEAPALALLREAHEIMPNELSIREKWLQMEGRIGDQGLALHRRRQIQQDEPSNIQNAAALISLLGNLEVERELITDEFSKPQYDEQSWNQLSPTEQKDILAETKIKWEKEADAIIDFLETTRGDTLAIANARATLRWQRGDIQGGLEILEQFMASRSEAEWTSDMFIALARYQNLVSRPQDAIATLERGLPHQDDSIREIDEALGNLYFANPLPEYTTKSLEHFRRTLAKREFRPIRMKIVEGLIRLKQFDEAEREMETAMGDEEYDLLATMLSAYLADGRGGKLLAEGRTEEAGLRYADCEDMLSRAREMDPSNQGPYLLEAQSLLTRHEHTGKRELLDQAIQVLDNAEAIRKGNREVHQLRSNAYRAQGNLRAAAGELRRALVVDPHNLAIRRELVEILAGEGEIGEAIQEIRTGIEYDNTIVLWHQRLGDMLLPGGRDVSGAVEAYHSAFNLTGAADQLILWVNAMLTGPQADHDAVLSLLEENQSFLSASPQLQLYRVLALNGVQKREEAMTLMREVYETIMIDQAEWSIAMTRNLERWFLALARLFTRQEMAEAEGFVVSLAGESPDTRILYMLSRHWSRLGTEGLSRAIELQRRALESCPLERKEFREQLYIDLGGYLFATEQMDEAIAAYEEAAELNADNPAALNNIAFVAAEKLNDPGRAFPYAKRALAISPNDPSILDTLGWVHYKMNQFDQAVRYLLQSLERRNLAETHMHLAYAYYRQRDIERARRHIRQAKELPLDEAIRAEIERLEADIRDEGN